MKVNGWWGRLEQFKPGDRVWVWLKLDRKKNPVSVVMLADEASEHDMHGDYESRGRAGEAVRDEARTEQRRGCAALEPRTACRAR